MPGADEPCGRAQQMSRANEPGGRAERSRGGGRSARGRASARRREIAGTILFLFPEIVSMVSEPNKDSGGSLDCSKSKS